MKADKLFTILIVLILFAGIVAAAPMNVFSVSSNYLPVQQQAQTYNAIGFYSTTTNVNIGHSYASDIRLANEWEIARAVDLDVVAIGRLEIAADRIFGTLNQGLHVFEPELRVTSMDVSGDTTAGQQFTISITAMDSDDFVTRIGFAPSPYLPADYIIKDCNPAANSCTRSFQLSESQPGTYTYMIKVKNERDQIVTDAVTVMIVEDMTTDVFNFRTSALDGASFDEGVVDYIDSVISVRDEHDSRTTIQGSPFATFSVQSNELLQATYTKGGYVTDDDFFYFDERLPSCSGPSCSFTAQVNEVAYTTTCELKISDYHYDCTVSNSEGYEISFDFRAEGDSIGPNTIRRYNPIYGTSDPVVEFGNIDVNFEEGGEYILTLDDYVVDDDTSVDDLEWTFSGDSNIQVDIDADRQATLTQQDPNWIGNEVIRFTAEDLEENTGSDLITVRVLNLANNPPEITDKTPAEEAVNLGAGSSLEFSISTFDPDYDRLTTTWKVDNNVVATGKSYGYADIDGNDKQLVVEVTDGTHTVAELWSISIVQPIGTVAGFVTDASTTDALDNVLVELFDGQDLVDSTSTDLAGHYLMTVRDGIYRIQFSKEGYVVHSEEIRIPPQETTQLSVELVPEATTGFLEGGVSADEAPLADVSITVRDQQGSVVDSTTTAGNGIYSLELVEGSYDVTFEKSGYDTEEIQDVVITIGQTNIQDVVMTMTPTAGTLSGTVTSDSAPLESVQITVRQGGSVVDTTSTIADGTYSMTLEAGSYDITFEKSGYEPQTISNVQITASQTTTRNMDLAAIAQQGTLQGIVRDVDTLNAISGATVTVKKGAQTIDSTTTSGAGIYSLLLDADTYDVEFTADGYGAGIAPGIVVNAGQTVTLDMELTETYPWINPDATSAWQILHQSGGNPSYSYMIDIDLSLPQFANLAPSDGSTLWCYDDGTPLNQELIDNPTTGSTWLRLWNVDITADLTTCENTPRVGPTDDSGIVLDYWFDEGSGPTLYDHDRVGDSQEHGTINGATWSQDVPNSCFENSLSFDGVDDYVRLGNIDSIIKNTASWSISTWFKHTSGGGARTMYGWRKSTSPNEQIGVRKIDSGHGWLFDQLQMSFKGSSGDTLSCESGDTYVDGNWHNLIIVFTENGESDTAEMFVDGVLKCSGAGNLGDITLGYDFPIGYSGESGGQYWLGEQTHFSLWNKALSDTEISSLYNQGNCLTTTVGIPVER